MTDPAKAIRTIKRPELVTIGARTVSVTGWHFSTAEDHLKSHLTRLPSKRWCTPACMANTMMGRSSPTNQQGVRRRVAKLFNHLLGHGMFLAIEYIPVPHRTINAFKILEKTEMLEVCHAAEQVERMRARRELNEEKYLKALDLIGQPTQIQP